MNGFHYTEKSITILSHELRTPLNAIIGYSEMLVEECSAQDWKELSPDLHKINQAGKDLLEVIKQAFNPIRVESLITQGKQTIISSKLDFQVRTSMNAIIGYTEMVWEEAEEEGCQEIIPELQKILTAANLFLKLFCNVNDTQIEVGLNKSLFQENFSLSLEQESFHEETPNQKDCTAFRQKFQGSILVVEDNRSNQEMLTHYLNQLGHTVTVAENGQQALEMIALQPYDLILLDIIMPVMDGFQVLAQIKTNNALRDIPVIIISSLDDLDNIVRGIRMGADDCLPKPFDAIILGARVEACLERKRWHDQEQEYLAIIKAEREKTENLLKQILPTPITERLKQGEKIIADGFDDVTILFADIVSFTPLTTQMKPKALVILLNDLFCMFDDLVRLHNLEKIRAIGDEFVVAAGLLKSRSDHVEAIADFALEMMKGLADYNASHNYSLEMRIGIETGSVIAGVIGTTQFSYDLWGDAINTASRMQSHGLGGRIHLTENVYRRLKDKYFFEERGVIHVKGKGDMCTYFLTGNRSPA